MNEIIIDEKYRALVDDIKTTITEAVYQSRWALVEGYWNVGKLIRECFTNGQLTKRLQDLAVDVGMSERILWYALQFYDKYSDLNKLPEGKNITWNKIITKYLTTSKEPDQLAQDYTLRCPVCGLEYECPKCGRKYKL